MGTIARQDQLRRWSAVVAGLLVAFLLIAPLFVTLAWDEGGLGPTPGAALIGTSVLVMAASIAVDPRLRHKNVDRIRKVLLFSGIALALTGVYFWP
ncbi:MAG: hypothetical protein JWR85_3127 [Marmoricola sp.]|nr:hypothetical protein [Marmoricola sp.]